MQPKTVCHNLVQRHTTKTHQRPAPRVDRRQLTSFIDIKALAPSSWLPTTVCGRRRRRGCPTTTTTMDEIVARLVVLLSVCLYLEREQPLPIKLL